MKLSEAKICFVAIFRNESRNVYRCLDSVRDLVSYVSICDTGSEDSTVELIKEWGVKNNKPTKVHHKDFVNFGYNRTLSFQLAKESFPDSDYCLLLDADMILMLEDGWRNTEIRCDQYLINQKNNCLIYANTRLVRTSLDWRCVGVTHEYWDGKNTSSNKKSVTNDLLKIIWIDDKDDGGHKHDKYVRDEKLLLGGLQDENEPPDLKVRYLFYLAQTYKSMREWIKSIHYYRKRIDAGGWDQEVFYSYLQIGNCYKELGQTDKAAGIYLEAWQKRPTRAEPLHELSNMYRLQGKNLLAYNFAKIGSKIPQPDDTLFVDHTVYNWGFYQELSITAFYVPGKKHVGKRSIKRLLKLKNTIPEHIYELAVSNAKHYGIKVT